MNGEDIIRLAQEAGCGWTQNGTEPFLEGEAQLQRFADLVAADKDKEILALVQTAGLISDAEREAYEKVAKENTELLQVLQNLYQVSYWSAAPEEMDAAKAAIEKAIRARGEI